MMSGKGITVQEWREEGMRYGYICDSCGVFFTDYDDIERHVKLYHRFQINYATEIAYRRISTKKVTP